MFLGAYYIQFYVKKYAEHDVMLKVNK